MTNQMKYAEETTVGTTPGATGAPLRPKKPLYQELAALFGAYLRCLSKDANESQKSWASRHKAKIEELVKEHMPSGSGFDAGTKFEFGSSTPEKLVFLTEFHHMDEHGSYDGWTQHNVVVTPSLAFLYNMRITGRDRNDIKDYMGQVFNEALYTLVD